VHGHALACANLRHPLAQRRDGDFAPNDDERGKHIGTLQVHEHEQRGANQEFVRHGVEKRAER
jgi:hypothetical protein